MSKIDLDKDAPIRTVALNTHVEIELVDQHGEHERLSFDLVPDDRADYYTGLLGESTPIARAILGQAVGSVLPYQVADIQQIKILSVKQLASQVSTEAANRRKSASQEALKQAQRTNALIFATSVDGKWGDYDADGMIENWD